MQRIAADLGNNRTELAEKKLTEYLAGRPDDPDALRLLAQLAGRRGRRREAASLLERCLGLAPDFAEARFEYAKLLAGLHEYFAALGEVDRLLTRDSRNPLFRQLKANILGAAGEDEQSLVIWRELAAENPERSESWVDYGHALRATGSRDRSIAAYRKAIECRGAFGAAWWCLANLKIFRFSDAERSAMQQQLNCGEVTADDRINLQFALGKAYEDLGAYDRSFEHYARGNAARRLRVDYDWDAIRSLLTLNKAVFTRDFLESRRDAGCSAEGPIFVLGRPRSGSTLIEQILASHSAIEGTAELPYLADLAFRFDEGGFAAGGIDYPQILETLEPSALAALGEEYLKKAGIHRRLGRPFFIDKAPANYHHIGMIGLILPNARIIDARRNPAACCLSMFKHNYSDTNLRLSELGRVYREYVELMAHFDRVMPGRIHRVIYEEMVADPELQIRKMLDYVGLPFEERCLRFYETERTVRSPSSEQVRKPVSGDAVHHWRKFEPWLTPLIESLGSVLAAYPGVPDELR
ncbi:MAG TPA: sulfotransferase [Rhizomicrobium sp.]